jgi:pimeloyl-ACP methyl ester carboxylesterase
VEVDRVMRLEDLQRLGVRSNYVLAGGIRTHYLEAGEGPTLVLLHSGEFGGCAELSWERNILGLAEHFRVLAPDYLGFGRSDKLRDFGGHGRRVIRHVSDFLATMCVTEADFIGNSVSGRWLCNAATGPAPTWPIRRMVCVSGGGEEPQNQARRDLQEYDGSREAMKRVLAVLFHDPGWREDEEYLDRRIELSKAPGAWEVAAAARFHAPWVPERPMFGRPDKTRYEEISVPTLFVAGAADPLLPERYWEELVRRTPTAESLVIEDAAHCPHLEDPDTFNARVVEFLTA